MEKINGKQVVRVGVIGDSEDIRKQLIKAMCHAYGSGSPDFNTSSSTIHENFKVDFKEIGIETEKYYYQLIYYPDDISTSNYTELNIDKCLIMGAAKPDFFLFAVNRELSRRDVDYLDYVATLRIPLAGIFIHYDKPRHGEEEIDHEALEHGVREMIESRWFYSTPENYKVSDLRMALVDAEWTQEVKHFVGDLDRSVVSCLQSAKEDRLNNGPKDTWQIETLVFTSSKQEGYDKPIENGQKVVIEFASAKLKATITSTNGEKFEDVRKIINYRGLVQTITINLKQKQKVGKGDRFLMKVGDRIYAVDGRIDAVGIVRKVNWH